ncbi:MAG: DinB family protein [Proteobacteria bacterium]|nr:DinB family protein [Pseudomonadota bacterium]
MTAHDHVRQMAGYNAWMNARLFEAARGLSEDALRLDRKAFFGSILGTLNHLVVADRIWLKRFATHPAHTGVLDPVVALPDARGLDQILFPAFAPLLEHRRFLDALIVAWADTLTDRDLEHVLRYTNMRRTTFEREFFSLLMHFFNHQTHHRGQATTLLSQAGVDVGATDLLVRIPDQRAE